MNEHDVIRHMGRFPDGINPTKRLSAETWYCRVCGESKPGPTVPDKPCECGSIFWQAKGDKNA